MRLRLFVLSFALTNLSYNGVQYAITAQSETRPAVLSAEDMMRILPGNTLLAYDQSGLFWMYFPSPGTVWGQSSSGDVDVGQWWIEDGHYCRSWRRWYEGETQCWLLASYGEDRIVWMDGQKTIQGESLVQHGNVIGEMKSPQLASLTADIPLDPVAVVGAIGPDPTTRGDHAGRVNRSAANGAGGSTGSSGSSSSGGGLSSGGSSGGSSSGGSSGGGSSGGGSSGGSGGSSGGGFSGGDGGSSRGGGGSSGVDGASRGGSSGGSGSSSGGGGGSSSGEGGGSSAGDGGGSGGSSAGDGGGSSGSGGGDKGKGGGKGKSGGKGGKGGKGDKGGNKGGKGHGGGEKGGKGDKDGKGDKGGKGGKGH